MDFSTIQVTTSTTNQQSRLVELKGVEILMSTDDASSDPTPALMPAPATETLKFGQDSVELPVITPSMMEEIRAAWDASDDEILQGKPGHRLTGKDMKTLKPGSWLNDIVMSAYFALIEERSVTDKQRPVTILSSLTSASLLKLGYEKFKLRKRYVNIFDYDTVLCPIHLPRHWTLGIIDNDIETIIFLNSLGEEKPEIMRTLDDFVRGESQELKGAKKKYKFNFPRHIPRQTNSFDCGVFVCQYAEYWSRLARFDFTEDDMEYFRAKMTWELLHDVLLT
jgi:sentrin-specific protease 1